MMWTREAKLDALVRLPWTVDVDRNAEEGYLILRVRELPGTIATGDEEVVEREFWESLRATLACYLEFDDPIPLPLGVALLPWNVPAPTRRTIVRSRSSVEMFAYTAGSGAFTAGAA